MVFDSVDDVLLDYLIVSLLDSLLDSLLVSIISFSTILLNVLKENNYNFVLNIIY